MKKALLGSVSLMAAAFALSLQANAQTAADAAPATTAPAVEAPAAEAPAQAAGPQLTINGTATLYAGVVRQKSSSRFGLGKGKGYHFAVEQSEVSFLGSGTTKEGMGYLGKIVISGQPNFSQIIKQNYMQMDGSWGTVQFGNVDGTEDAYLNDGSILMGGTGGFSGAWTDMFAATSNVLISDVLVGNTADATKFNYFTPRYEGFQVGFSFTPNSAHMGDGILKDNANPQFTGVKNSALPYDLRHMGFGMNFSKDWGAWHFSFSATGVTGRSKSESGNSSVHNTSGYQLGTVVGYGPWEFGLGYVDNRKTHVKKNLNGANAGKAGNAAVAYTFGANKFALGYYHSQTKFPTITANTSTGNLGSATINSTFADGGVAKKLKADIFSVTYNRHVTDGMEVFGDLNFINMKAPKQVTGTTIDPNHPTDPSAVVTTVASNKGTTFMIGSRVNF